MPERLTIVVISWHFYIGSGGDLTKNIDELLVDAQFGPTTPCSFTTPPATARLHG
jgi:hypothetical protein